MNVKEKISSKLPKNFLVILLTVLLGASIASTDFYTFDGHFHMSAGEHYAEDWTALTMEGSSGGLMLETYPPVAHQFLTIISYIMPIETGFNILMFVFWIALTYNLTMLFIEYLDYDKDRFWLIFVLLFANIGAIKKIFVYGMYPSMVGFTFGVFALRMFIKAFENNDKVSWVFFVLFYAMVGYTNTYSFLFFSLLYAMYFVSEIRLLDKSRFVKTILSVFSVFILILVGLPELVSDLFSGALVSGNVIPHDSWYSFFEYSLEQIESWVTSDIGLASLGLFLPLFWDSEDGKLKKLYFGALFLVSFDMFGINFLPRIFFPGVRFMINYERFTIFAGFMFTFLLAHIIFTLIDKIDYKEVRKYFLVLFCCLFVLAHFSYLFRVHNLYNGEDPLVEEGYRQEFKDYILTFLEEKASDNYRFQTLGYGYRVTELIRKTDVPMMDGKYYQGVPIDWIINLEQEAIDRSSTSNAIEFVKRAHEVNVKYIFTFNKYRGRDYSKIMDEANPGDWEVKESSDIGQKEVTVWVNDGVEPIGDVEINRSKFQTVVPLGITILSLIAVLFRKRLKQKKDSARVYFGRN